MLQCLPLQTIMIIYTPIALNNHTQTKMYCINQTAVNLSCSIFLTLGLSPYPIGQRLMSKLMATGFGPRIYSPHRLHSTLQQHNFVPVATSDLSVCITALSLSLSLSLSFSRLLSLSLSFSLALPHTPCSLRVGPLYIIGAAPLYNTVLTLDEGLG